jgi:hypothetical protein
MKSSGFRIQSAMEYLMTYGWAILIIAVVLGVLFTLNVFSLGSQLGTSCIGQPGYSCSVPAISSNGVLSFTLGLGTGYNIYNVVASCISSASTLTAGTTPFNVIGGTALAANGVAIGPSVTAITYATSTNSIATSSTVLFSGIQCYSGSSGSTPATPTPIGTPFTGTIWLGYTTTGSGQMYYIKTAAIAVKSSS